MLTREVPVPPRRSIGGLLAGVATVGVLLATIVPELFAYPQRCRGREEVMQLGIVGRHAEAYFLERGAFPRGRTQALPPWSCCPAKCGVVPQQAWAADPVWVALDFSVDEATQVQYSYESDGNTFRATAVGEPECDGVRTEFVLEGWIDGNGDPVTRLLRPPPRP